MGNNESARAQGRGNGSLSLAHKPCEVDSLIVARECQRGRLVEQKGRLWLHQNPVREEVDAFMDSMMLSHGVHFYHTLTSAAPTGASVFWQSHAIRNGTLDEECCGKSSSPQHSGYLMSEFYSNNVDFYVHAM